MEHRYTIIGHVPSKKNSKTIICRGSYPMMIPSKSFRAWHEDATQQMELLKPKPLGAVKRLHLKFYAKTKRGNDLTNKAESVNDLLVECGVLDDDDWHHLPSVELEYGGVDTKNPRVEITLYPQ